MRVCDTLVGTHVFDTWKCGSLSFIFTHPPEDKKKKKEKKKGTHEMGGWVSASPGIFFMKAYCIDMFSAQNGYGNSSC